MLLAIVLALSFVPSVLSYSGGPPASVCTSMIPGHYGTSPQTTISKFYVKVSKTRYILGEEISVTLSGCDGAMFKGFILQARRVDIGNATSAAIGRFNTPSGSKGLTCGSDFAAVTHSDANLKSYMTFLWTAPDTSAGHIAFTATFVEDISTYWVKVNSPVVVDNSLSNPPGVSKPPPGAKYPSPATCLGGKTTLIMPQTWQPFTDQNAGWTTRKMGMGVRRYPDCVDTKGCIYECYDGYCKVGITWITLPTTNEVLFEMSLSTPKYDNIWMAMGLSEDTMMGDDQVVECVLRSGSVAVYSSENSPYYSNLRLDNVDQLRGIGGVLSDGVFTCSFTLSLDKVQYPFYKLEEEHNILFAIGDLYPGSDDKQKHTERMMTVYPRVKLTSPGIHTFGGWAQSGSCKPSNVYPLMMAALLGIMLWRNY